VLIVTVTLLSIEMGPKEPQLYVPLSVSLLDTFLMFLIKMPSAMTSGRPASAMPETTPAPVRVRGMIKERRDER